MEYQDVHETHEPVAPAPKRGGKRGAAGGSFFDRLMDSVAENVRVVYREFQLFLGSTLLLLGLLSFESDKFCDGNTADYLSCTRPSTFYYFDTLDIALIIIGALLVLAWVLKNRRNY